MIKQVYTLRDSKAEVYLQPFFELTDGSAQRAILQAMKNPESIMNVHKDDLALYHIGAYDDSLGEMIPKEPITCIGTLTNLEAIEKQTEN